MLKTAAAVAALTTLAASPAMAQSLTQGQYIGTTEYVSVTDTAGHAGNCEAIGILPGKITKSVATVGGLGNTWTQVLAAAGNGSGLTGYGVTPVSCTFGSALPATSTFTQNADGSYSSTPAAAQTTTCLTTIGGTASGFTLTSQNGTATDGTPQTLKFNVLANPAGSADSSFQLQAGNTALASIAGGGTICYVTISAQYLLSGANLLAQ